jgi:xanthine/CO dehydrogenase XdhC/CoxF family maturation factor
MVMSAIFANYTAVAQRLGLVWEDGRIHGVVDGISLQMSFGAHAVRVTALLPTPASIDLSVATKGLIGRLGDLFGGHGDVLGDPELDKLFAVKATNTARVAQLLGVDARRALLEIEKEGLHPAIDAHSIHLRRFSTSALDDSQEKIERDFREAARLARAVSASFSAAAPPA